MNIVDPTAVTTLIVQEGSPINSQTAQIQIIDGSEWIVTVTMAPGGRRTRKTASEVISEIASYLGF